VRNPAKAGEEYIRQQRARLETFATDLTDLENHFVELERQFRTTEKIHLSIRLFDEADFDKFYKLEFDTGTGRHLPVSVPEEYRRFLQASRASGALQLMEMMERETVSATRKSLRVSTSRRFHADFEACKSNPDTHPNCGRQIDILKHPAMMNAKADTYDRFVRSALPMLGREPRFAGEALNTMNRVFLGLPITGVGPYIDFEQTVRNRLQGMGYHKVEAFATNDPTAIHLFIESYAFPLGAVSLVVDTCHNACYEFYRTQRLGPKTRPTTSPCTCAPIGKVSSTI
jgi:hypothetical protein